MSFKDDYPMTFGKYRGTLMANVPAAYLLWLWDNSTEFNREKGYNKGVFGYIKENLEVLREEVKKEKK